MQQALQFLLFTKLKIENNTIMKKLNNNEMSCVEGGVDWAEVALGVGCIGGLLGCVAAGPVGWVGAAALVSATGSCLSLLAYEG